MKKLLPFILCCLAIASNAQKIPSCQCDSAYIGKLLTKKLPKNGVVISHKVLFTEAESEITPVNDAIISFTELDAKSESVTYFQRLHRLNADSIVVLESWYRPEKRKKCLYFISVFQTHGPRGSYYSPFLDIDGNGKNLPSEVEEPATQKIIDGFLARFQ